MSLYSKDSLIKEDTEILINSNFISWEKLRDMHILVTGGTGLIGSQLVTMLLLANKEKNLNITIILPVRNIEKAKELFDDFTQEKLIIFQQNIVEPIIYSGEIDYIIHGASVTSSKDFVDYPVETIYTAIHGTENILEIAKQKNIKGMVYLSSLEIYGVMDFNIKEVNETMNGVLDSMSVRSSYSEGKRMAECLCASYASEFNIPIKVARLCQTFGPGVNYSDNRVFAQFARSVIEGKKIVLKTNGSTERNYCYIRDAINGIMTILLKGESKEAYNVANKTTLISIKEMAQLLIDIKPETGSSIEFDIVEDVTKLGYNPKVKINLDTQKLELLGWTAQVGLADMFKRLMLSMEMNK